MQPTIGYTLIKRYTTIFFTKFCTDVRIWILLLGLIRLEQINLAPYDAHTWRQTVTLGVARNYMEVSPAFFEPRTLNCDSRSGIIAQEFPLFNYLIFLLWSLLGQQHWVPRLLNLLVSSFGLWFFAKIAERLTDRRVALFATVLFGVSIAFIYARKAMPDTFSVSLVLAGVYFGWRWLETGRRGYLWAYFTGICLGMLCKMPAACELGLLAAPLWQGPLLSARKRPIYLLGLLALGIMGAWYFIWVPQTTDKYGFPLMFPTGLVEGFKQLVTLKGFWMERFYPIALTSKIAFAFFVFGLLGVLIKRVQPILLTLTASGALLTALMLKAGGTFAVHEYYVIPFVPTMALIAAWGLSALVRHEGLAFAVLSLMAIEAIAKHKPDFFIAETTKRYVHLEKLVNQYIPKDAKIAVNTSGFDPSMMYAAHRRGWATETRLQDTAWIASESTVGLQYIVIDRSRMGTPLPYPLIFENDEFRIYKVPVKT